MAVASSEDNYNMIKKESQLAVVCQVFTNDG